MQNLEKSQQKERFQEEFLGDICMALRVDELSLEELGNDSSRRFRAMRNSETSEEEVLEYRDYLRSHNDLYDFEFRLTFAYEFLEEMSSNAEIQEVAATSDLDRIEVLQVTSGLLTDLCSNAFSKAIVQHYRKIQYIEGAELTRLKKLEYMLGTWIELELRYNEVNPFKGFRLLSRNLLLKDFINKVLGSEEFEEGSFEPTFFGLFFEVCSSDEYWCQITSRGQLDVEAMLSRLDEIIDVVSDLLEGSDITEYDEKDLEDISKRLKESLQQ